MRKGYILFILFIWSTAISAQQQTEDGPDIQENSESDIISDQFITSFNYHKVNFAKFILNQFRTLPREDFIKAYVKDNKSEMEKYLYSPCMEKIVYNEVLDQNKTHDLLDITAIQRRIEYCENKDWTAKSEELWRTTYPNQEYDQNSYVDFLYRFNKKGGFDPYKHIEILLQIIASDSIYSHTVLFSGMLRRISLDYPDIGAIVISLSSGTTLKTFTDVSSYKTLEHKSTCEAEDDSIEDIEIAIEKQYLKMKDYHGDGYYLHFLTSSFKPLFEKLPEERKLYWVDKFAQHAANKIHFSDDNFYTEIPNNMFWYHMKQVLHPKFGLKRTHSTKLFVENIDEEQNDYFEQSVDCSLLNDENVSHEVHYSDYTETYNDETGEYETEYIGCYYEKPIQRVSILSTSPFVLSAKGDNYTSDTIVKENNDSTITYDEELSLDYSFFSDEDLYKDFEKNSLQNLSNTRLSKMTTIAIPEIYEEYGLFIADVGDLQFDLEKVTQYKEGEHFGTPVEITLKTPEKSRVFNIQPVKMPPITIQEKESPEYEQMYADGTMTGLIYTGANRSEDQWITDEYLSFFKTHGYTFKEPVDIKDFKNLLEEKTRSGELDYIKQDDHIGSSAVTISELASEGKIFEGNKKLSDGRLQKVYIFKPVKMSSMDNERLMASELSEWTKSRKENKGSEVLYIDARCSSDQFRTSYLRYFDSAPITLLSTSNGVYPLKFTSESANRVMLDSLINHRDYNKMHELMEKYDPKYKETESNNFILPNSENYNDDKTKRQLTNGVLLDVKESK